MIKYNTLQIDGDYLIVDLEIEDKEYYGGVFIEGIRVDTPLTYKTDYPYYEFYDKDNDKVYSGRIPISNIKGDLIIVTPKVDLTQIPSDAPCGADIVNKAIVYDKNVLFDKGLTYLKELGDTCKMPRGFIDFILKSNALDLAIATCNYNMAIKYWKMLTMVKGTTIKGCGCDG